MKNLFNIIIIFALLFVCYYSISDNNYIDKVYASNSIVIENSCLTNLNINSNYLSIVDQTNNKVYIYDVNNNSISSFGTVYDELNPENGGFKNLNSAFTLSDGQIYAYDSIIGLILFDSNFDFIKRIYLASNGDNLEQVIAGTCDYNDNVYVIDENKKLYTKNCNNSYISFTSTLSELDLNFDVQIFANLGNELFILNGQNIYEFDINTSTFTLIFQTSDYQFYNSITCDYLNNLYVICENSLDNSNYVLKIGQNEQLNYEILSETLYSNSGILLNACINYETGQSFYITDSSQDTLFSNYLNDEFFNSLQDFTKGIDFAGSSTLNNSVEIINIVENTIIYKYPLKISVVEELNSYMTTMLIKSNIKILNNEDYSLIVYSYTSNSQTYLDFGYVKTNSYSIIESDIINDSAKIANISAMVYKFPTTCKVLDNYGVESSLIIDKLYLNDEIYVLKDLSIYEDYNGFSFYAIQLSDDSIGYILKSSIIFIETTQTYSINVANATIKTNSEQIAVYKESNNNEIIAYVSNNQNIYIDDDNFDSSLSYTYIEFLNDDNEYILGYVETSNINTSTSNLGFLIGFISIVLAGIILLIMFLTLNFKKSNEN